MPCKQGVGSGFGAEASQQPRLSARAEWCSYRSSHSSGPFSIAQVLSLLLEKTKKKYASLGQQLHQGALIKYYKKSLLIHGSLMDTTMLSAESHLPGMLPADVLARRGSALVAHPAPQTDDSHHMLVTTQEPRDLVTANKEQSEDNLFGRTLRWMWLISQKESKLIKKTKTRSNKAVTAHTSQLTTGDRKTV